MPHESEDAVSTARLPDLHTLIVAAGAQHLPPGRPGHAVDPTGMPPIRVDRCATDGAPDLYSPVLASGGNPFTSRRPCDGGDLFSVTSVDEPAPAGVSLKNLY